MEGVEGVDSNVRYVDGSLASGLVRKCSAVSYIFVDFFINVTYFVKKQKLPHLLIKLSD